MSEHAPDPAPGPASGPASSSVADLAAPADEKRWARELTHAILTHYGYTAEDIAAVEAVHPGRVCDEEECFDEDGDSVHGPAFNELGFTAATMVDVVVPWVSNLLAQQAAQQGGHSSAGPEVGRSLVDVER